ncbi:carboxymethylenebutenolidase [Cavenderia fasciculata]|uniref:Carboxymethylenebutenolidase n=1 Tax=Cavenderia fasciculata TaxID=261658 RepID=F4PX00_CACFS|nr:carboxymethylenebutenolidase [Cavenderia fasciculata]EGG19803.1 carboxymethylenebutenolidase [Cavenderia fasciculata]|eukprot:XP_004358149.1 carboxymethylenebutenolidase [Cavenderia fasciculata]
MGDGLVCDTYVSLPKGLEEGNKKKRDVPAILFLMDAIGLRPRIEEMVDVIASQGYYVIAPNLFYRTGKQPMVDNLQELLAQGQSGREQLFTHLRPIMMSLKPESIMEDIGKWIGYIDRQTEHGVVPNAPIGVVGYCMGGTNAFRASAIYPDRIVAVASFHGGNLVTDQTNSPHLSASKVKAELYFGHADNDHSIGPQQIATLEKTLTDANIKYTSEVYQGAAHGYTMKDTVMYNEAGEKRHWVALTDLLTRVFKQPQQQQQQSRS